MSESGFPALLIETPRLWLREMTIDDAVHFFALNADPEVIRYTGDLPFESVDAARDFLAAYDTYRKYGFGRWAVIRKEDDVFLGWCGLKFDPVTGETDIGFRFFRDHWGRGYATESALASLQWGLVHLATPEFIGRAMKANTASVRVLEKIGMRFRNDALFHGGEGVVYHYLRS